MTMAAARSASRHLVHPSLVPALAFVPPFASDPAGLAENRAMIAAMTAELPPLSEGVERSELVVPGLERAPDVRALLYRPAGGAAPRLAVLHLHPGGFILGSPEMSEARNAALVAELGCAVLSVDYRLAPEHPWPAALEDALAAWRWLGEEFAAAKTVVLGESAGGGLAASLSHRLLALRRPLPALQALIYPMLDPRSGLEGVASPVFGEHVWTRANNRFAWAAYLGKAKPGAGAAAGLERSVEGLPPTFMLTGALDLFLNEDIDYARRLANAGVPTELHVIAGAYHGFDMAGPSPCADQLNTLLTRALAAI
jgi:acetyl esterase/lipase